MKLTFAFLLMIFATICSASPFNGIWQSEWQPYPSSKDMPSLNIFQKTLRIDDQKIRLDVKVFVLSPLGRAADLVSIEFDLALLNPKTDGMFDIDLKAAHMFETPLSAIVADDHNETSRCGLTNWKIGIPQDIIGRQCDEDEVDVLKKGDLLKAVIFADPKGEYLQIARDIFDDTKGTSHNSPDERSTELSPTKFWKVTK